MLDQIMEALEDPNQWNGLEIRYKFPNVDRIWCNIGSKTKLCLHKIFPIPDGEQAFFHAHPWEFETLIIDGAYFTNIGFSQNIQEVEDFVAPPVAARYFLTEGSWYRMNDPKMWHSVEPITPVTSIVLIRSHKGWPQLISSGCLKGNFLMQEERIVTLAKEFSKTLSDRSQLLTCSPMKLNVSFEKSIPLRSA